MDKFEVIQTLATGRNFTIFEAYAKKLQFAVVLKKCEYTDDTEAERFIRSALVKTRNKIYLQPLLSIFADSEPFTQKIFIAFVWKKGESLDAEVEHDQALEFFSGKAGYGQSIQTYTNPQTQESVEKVQCLTLGQEVIRKVSKKPQIADLNPIFEEALAHARCIHPNICEFLDFRLFQLKKGWHCTYIVIEKLSLDLNTEIEERKGQAYEETELLDILLSVSTGLLHAKSLNFAHGDIKPANILRGPSGLKLFGSTWPTQVDSQQFESDVFSLGMTLLHLASLAPPMNNEALQQQVHVLSYSDEFKQLLAAMLALHDRPSLDSIAKACIPLLKEQAYRIKTQGNLSYYDENFAKAEQMFREAATIYSRLPEDRFTAINLMNWGGALNALERNEEALAKFAVAEAIYSQLPEEKSNAVNIANWGYTLTCMRKCEEAVVKLEAAHAMHSRLSVDKYTADNLRNWGKALSGMGRSEEAVAKFAAAEAVYSRLTSCKERACNFRAWAKALKRMERWQEAVSNIEANCAVFASIEEPFDADKFEREITALVARS